ncbi:MAG: hypothetical protein ACR2NU_13345 [Aeoliella sp.]
MPEEFNPFAAPQTSDAAAPHLVWATDQPEALRRVKLGLTFVYVGICGILLAGISLPIVGMMVFGQGPGVESVAWFGMLVFGLMTLLTLLMVTGELLCTAVPSESGGKALAIAAVALQGFSFVVGLASGFLLEDTSIEVAIGVQVVLNLLGIASLVCFVLFMRRVATYIGRYDLVGRATRVLIVGGVAVVLLIGYGIFVATLGNQFGPPVGASFAGVIGGLLILVALVMYANMVTYLRKAITA